MPGNLHKGVAARLPRTYNVFAGGTMALPQAAKESGNFA
jgi:hypothetical protein